MGYKYFANSVTVLTNAKGLYQIKSLSGLGSVTNANTNGYTINFFNATNVLGFTNGAYSTANSPQVTFIVTNLDNGSLSNRLRVTRIENAISLNYDFSYSAGGWSLTTALRIETVASGTTNSVRTVTRRISSTNGTSLHVVTRSVKAFSWGQGLIEEITGTGPNPLTNSYTYNTDGTLRQANRSDGSWQIMVYDNKRRVTGLFSSFLNQSPTTNESLCRVTEYSFAPSGISTSRNDTNYSVFTPRLSTERLLGWEVARSYSIISRAKQMEIQCAIRGAAWNATDNTFTLTTNIVEGLFAGRPIRVSRSGGTGEYYLYSYTNGLFYTFGASGLFDMSWGPAFSGLLRGEDPATLPPGFPLRTQIADYVPARLTI